MRPASLPSPLVASLPSSPLTACDAGASDLELTSVPLPMPQLVLEITGRVRCATRKSKKVKNLSPTRNQRHDEIVDCQRPPQLNQEERAVEGGGRQVGGNNGDFVSHESAMQIVQESGAVAARRRVSAKAAAKAASVACASVVGLALAMWEVEASNVVKRGGWGRGKANALAMEMVGEALSSLPIPACTPTRIHIHAHANELEKSD